MIPNDEPQRTQMIQRMINHLYRDDTPLTPWESDFIVSISEQFEHRKTLSLKQCEILERIYDKSLE